MSQPPQLPERPKSTFKLTGVRFVQWCPKRTSLYLRTTSTKVAELESCQAWPLSSFVTSSWCPETAVRQIRLPAATAGKSSGNSDRLVASRTTVWPVARTAAARPRRWRPAAGSSSTRGRWRRRRAEKSGIPFSENRAPRSFRFRPDGKNRESWKLLERWRRLGRNLGTGRGRISTGTRCLDTIACIYRLMRLGT